MQVAEQQEHKRQAEELEFGQMLADSDDDGEPAQQPNAYKDARSTRRTAKRRRTVDAGLLHELSIPRYMMFGHLEASVEVDEYGVRESEPIAWLAQSMQEQGDTSELLQQASQHILHLQIPAG